MMILIFCFIVLLLMTTHPFPFMIFILIISILMAMNISFLYLNSFISFIFILMISGGMMVLMLFMTSLYPNEKFQFKKIYLFFFSPFLLIPLLNLSPFLLKKNNFFSVFLTTSPMIYLFLCLYLFILLIASMKLTLLNKSPLLN